MKGGKGFCNQQWSPTFFSPHTGWGRLACVNKCALSLTQAWVHSCACANGSVALAQVCWSMRTAANGLCGGEWGEREVCLGGPVRLRPRTSTGLQTRGWGPLL